MVASNSNESLAAVRALSEHRAPRRFLHTVPVREYRAPVPLIKNAWELDGVLLKSPADAPRARVERGTDINDALDLFKQSQPGEFTTQQACDFMMRAGWRVASGELGNLSGKLRRLYHAGAVAEVRTERQGKANLIIWRFT